MSKYVVTGGAGFIGSAVVRALLAEGAGRVAVIDNLATGHAENLDEVRGQVDFHEADIRRYEAIAPVVEGADAVFHLAAIPSVPRSIDDPVPSHETNIDGTFQVLRACHAGGVRRVFYAASSSAYGDTEVLPKVETMAPRPKSPYALQKLVGESYAAIFTSCFGLETVAVRYFNVYGPRQDPHSDYAAVIPKFIAHLSGGEPPLIYGDGKQTRDFVYVKDVVQANVKAMESKATGTYNVGCGEETSVNDLAETMIALFSSSLTPKHTRERPGEVKHSVADISRAKKDFGYSPGCSLKQGLMETLHYYDQQFRKATGQKG
jgi:nucleoside-diphosphate-sugar epimerase